jgi:hypothetical protein
MAGVTEYNLHLHRLSRDTVWMIPARAAAEGTTLGAVR